MRRFLSLALSISLLTGCTGFQRGCTSWSASTFGSDWIVVQYRMDGTPINCWRLPATSISNEDKSDGIYWLDSNTGNLVHISGWYNRVQVGRGGWDTAARSLGVELAKCSDGAYAVAAISSAPLAR